MSLLSKQSRRCSTAATASTLGGKLFKRTRTVVVHQWNKAPVDSWWWAGADQLSPAVCRFGCFFTAPVRQQQLGAVNGCCLQVRLQTQTYPSQKKTKKQKNKNPESLVTKSAYNVMYENYFLFTTWMDKYALFNRFGMFHWKSTQISVARLFKADQLRLTISRKVGKDRRVVTHSHQHNSRVSLFRAQHSAHANITRISNKPTRSFSQSGDISNS